MPSKPSLQRSKEILAAAEALATDVEELERQHEALGSEVQTLEQRQKFLKNNIAELQAQHARIISETEGLVNKRREQLAALTAEQERLTAIVTSLKLEQRHLKSS